MLTRWNDLDRTLSVIDEFRRRMDRVWNEIDSGYATSAAGAPVWPRANLYDAGQQLVLEVELPGVGENDIQLTLNQDVLTLAGERRADSPEGYAAHRQERVPLRFARSFQLPLKIDPEKVSATTSRGILQVRMTKAPESQPRSISVKAHA